MNREGAIVERILSAKKSYYSGGLHQQGWISDKEYDKLELELSELNPNHWLLSQTGYEVDGDKAVMIPVHMPSMRELKSIRDIHKWVHSLGGSDETSMVIMGKYDGISISSNESKALAWTRGNGVVGTDCSSHFSFISTKNNSASLDTITLGEMVIDKVLFTQKYGYKYSNPRNFVAGVFGDDSPRKGVLSDMSFVRYNVGDTNRFKYKSQILDYVNKHNEPDNTVVWYEIVKLSDINEEYLKNTFFSRVELDRFELDGLVIEINDLSFNRINANGVPQGIIKYKKGFDITKEVVISEVRYQVSKGGKLKPVIHFPDTEIDGIVAKKSTGVSAKYVQSNGWGVGARILIKRGGRVSPKIADTIQDAEVFINGVRCPSCNGKTDFDGVDLVCHNTKCPDRIIRLNYEFFKKMKIRGVGEGTIRALYKNGYTEILDLLTVDEDELSRLDGWGRISAKKFVSAIERFKSKPISIPEVMDASPYFYGMGIKSITAMHQNKGKLYSGRVVSGTDDSRYVTDLPEFYLFYNGIRKLLSVVKGGRKHVGTNFSGVRVVMTGFRDDGLKKIIESNGGVVTSAVSKLTTVVISSNIDGISGKLGRARELGIKIVGREEFLELYNVNY